MSKYGINHNGEIMDYRFEKKNVYDTMTCDRYAFYLGDIRIGTIWRHSKYSWTAISSKKNDGWPTMIENLNSRLAAANYLLKMNGYMR